VEIRPVGVELFHADGQTDRHVTKLIVAFRNFLNAPKKQAWLFMGPKKLSLFLFWNNFLI